jgi:hypothetical protein
VTVKPYDGIFTDLKELSQSLVDGEAKGGEKETVWMDSNKCNVALYQAVDSKYVKEKESPIALMKAIKNSVCRFPASFIACIHGLCMMLCHRLN